MSVAQFQQTFILLVAKYSFQLYTIGDRGSSCHLVFLAIKCHFLTVLLIHLHSAGQAVLQEHPDWQPAVIFSRHLCQHVLCHLICSSECLSPGLCTQSLHLNWAIIMENVCTQILMWQWDSHKHTVTFAQDKSNFTLTECNTDMKWGIARNLK